MTAKIIDGRKMAAELRDELAERVSRLSGKPHLAVVLAGNDEASLIYDRNKQKAAEKVGMVCDIYHLPEDVLQTELNRLIDGLNQDKNVNGIIVQLPLPVHLDAAAALRRILPEKDVDGFGLYNTGLLWTQGKAFFAPATPKGILHLLKSVSPDLSGKHAVIIGRSNIVGKPLAALLLGCDCTVTIAHSKSENLAALAASADILVAACGCAGLVRKEWVKPGAVVIDVGINRVEGKLSGDVDFDGVCENASYITPVPGGVGPMTVAMLLENTFEAYLQQSKETL